MNEVKNSIFREELPGEKKSIVNLLMTGHIVTISCLGYMAFFLFIQLGQVTRIVDTIEPNHMTSRGKSRIPCDPWHAWTHGSY